MENNDFMSKNLAMFRNSTIGGMRKSTIKNIENDANPYLERGLGNELMEPQFQELEIQEMDD